MKTALCAALATALAVSTGCVTTVVRSEKANVYRFAILYPFELDDLSVDLGTGVLGIKKYNTDGGAKNLAELIGNALAAYQKATVGK